MNNQNTSQAETNIGTVRNISDTPPKRRRKSSRRKKSNFKKYFEYLIWASVIFGFLYVIYSLVSTGAVKDKDAVKTKKSSSLKVVIDGPVS